MPPTCRGTRRGAGTTYRQGTRRGSGIAHRQAGRPDEVEQVPLTGRGNQARWSRYDLQAGGPDEEQKPKLRLLESVAAAPAPRFCCKIWQLYLLACQKKFLENYYFYCISIRRKTCVLACQKNDFRKKNWRKPPI